MSEAGPQAAYDIRKVLKALPHRYPLLLVDRVKSLELGERIHALKAVSFNEEFFQGHFPGAPIMPGVLQIEALAQAAAILGIETLELAGTGKLVFFMGIESAKFRAPEMIGLRPEHAVPGRHGLGGKPRIDPLVERQDGDSGRRRREAEKLGPKPTSAPPAPVPKGRRRCSWAGAGPPG